MTKKKKMIIISSSVISFLLVAVLIGLMLTGYFVAWGPFKKMSNFRFRNLAGNADKYSIENVQPLDDSPLKGMNICYLGSSVTYGAASLQTTFVEYIAKRNETTYVKEALNGTTLVTNGNLKGCYIDRMKKLDKNAKFDIFVCQLSTNDATQNRPLGEIDSTDTETISGGINTIIEYVKSTWNCPVVFYTNAYYESELYASMVEAIKEIAVKKGIYVIDLYTDSEFNDITSEQRSLYMADTAHPTKAGYLEWWTPKMEEVLYQVVGK